jgi:hypothetical protein
VSKLITAKEARDMADKSGVTSREVRSILRSIKRTAKRGKYSLKISYSKWDSVVAEKICENLRELGYRACTDMWRAAIYVFWKGEE